MMLPFKIKGYIALQSKRLWHDGDECFGITEITNSGFSVRISNSMSGALRDFADTLAHELLHLYIFIMQGVYDKELSNAAHHRVTDKLVKLTVKTVNDEFKKRGVKV